MTLINDVLDLAKVEAGKMEVRPSEFRIGALIEAQCDMVRSLTDEKNIDLAFEAEGDEELMYQDQSKVLQILTNLLSNAIKFTPEGGRVVIRVRETGSTILVEVEVPGEELGIVVDNPVAIVIDIIALLGRFGMPLRIGVVAIPGNL